MKLTIALLIATFMQIHAEGFSQQISLSQKNAQLEQVFKQIMTQTSYHFLYNKQMLQAAKPVNIELTNVSLQEALAKCFEGQPLTYVVQNSTVIVKMKEAPFVVISGKVTNKKGEPLPGVSIVVKGTTKGVITDANGLYKLQINSSDKVLVISSIGMKKQEIAINGRTEINVVMEEDVTQLTGVEVVSNGYQTISKERVAGSFAKADMDIVALRSSSMNVLQSIDGLLPGLVVDNVAGRESVQYLVRGLTTIGAPGTSTGTYTGSNPRPLYVVDGLVLDDVSSINPQDVKDITLLKDATAASIWGARAANGVIVITTKKGTMNSKLKINYDGFVNFQGMPDLDYQPLLNSQQYIATAKEIFGMPNYYALNPWSYVTSYNTAKLGLTPHELILYRQARGLITAAKANSSLDSLAGLNNHQQIKDLWYRNAMLMNHTLSLSGGGAVQSFYGSFSYTDTKSNRPGETNTNFKVNIRQDFNFNKALKAYLITDLSQNNTSAQRPLSVNYNSIPYQLYRDASGNNLSIPYLKAPADSVRAAFEARSRFSLDYNPMNEMGYGFTKYQNLITRINGGVTVNLYDGLRFEGTYGYNKGSSKQREMEDIKSYEVRSEIVQYTVNDLATTTPKYYLPTTGNRYTVSTNDLQNWTVRNQLVYDKSWNNHMITLMAGQEAQEQKTVTVRTRTRGWDDALQTSGTVDYTTLGAAVVGTVMPNYANIASKLAFDAFGSTETVYRFTSYYANMAYTFNRKYTFNASSRIDQSTLFGKDKAAQNKPVWSVGGKWRLSDEDFMKGNSWVQQLSLRVTYGLTGNSPDPGMAASQSILYASGNNFYPGGIGLKVLTPANPKLTWETTKNLNIGVDFAILKGRISGSVDVYQKKTENMLGLINTNSLAGYPNVTGNMGNMTNKGIEISLQTINFQSKNFRWNSTLIFAYNKNMVDRLTSKSPITTADQKINTTFIETYPAFALFSYKWAGLDSLGDPRIMLSDGTITKSPSAATPKDIIYKGSTQPLFSGGFSNQLAYRNFNLYINMSYNLGHVMRRGRNLIYGASAGNAVASLRSNVSTEFLSRWKKAGDEAITDVPSFVMGDENNRRSINYFIYGDNNVIDASFIKIRDITLSYSLPKTLVQKIKAENISFRVQLSNIMFWKANKYGIDPEFPYYSNLPTNQHTITLGAHITL